MKGTQPAPAQLFYDFDLECHGPDNHLLREIDGFLVIDGMRVKLRSFYSHLGRPSIDPELIVRMLAIGYAMGIRPYQPVGAALQTTGLVQFCSFSCFRMSLIK